MRHWIVALTGLACLALESTGQVVPLSLTAYETQSLLIPANAISTLPGIPVEVGTAGGGSLDILTLDAATVVSLILPSGQELTAANAMGLGYSFLTGTANEGRSELAMVPGIHTIIKIPAGQVSGLYSVRADATNVAKASPVVVTYTPASSLVRIAATQSASNYAVGATAVLSGLLFDGVTPISGVTVTATVSAPISLDSQATVGNYQLVEQQVVNPQLTRYRYTATLTNSGSAATNVQAMLIGLPSDVVARRDTLIFGDVAATGSTPSINSFIVEHAPSLSFNPGSLQWAITTPGSPIEVTLVDGGTYDSTPNDGVYTGSFVPTLPGAYLAVLHATGTSQAGVSFARTAATRFEVTNQTLAKFASFSDTENSGDVTVTAALNVQTAGSYRFFIGLKATNGAHIESSASAELQTGSQQISIVFPRVEMFELGADGPYSRVDAGLMFISNTGDKLADQKADAGVTAPYVLTGFAPSLYLNGMNSAAGVVTGAGPAFDLLRVQLGVNLAAAQTCSWMAQLRNSTNALIDYSNGSGSVPAGASTLIFDFNGGKIAQAGPGPYVVTGVSITCGADELNKNNVFTISNFTPAQFASSASVSISPQTVTMPLNQSQQFTVVVNGMRNDIVWDVAPFYGAISPDGLYQAPATSPTNTVVVTASSASDPTKTAAATITFSGAVTADATFTPPAGSYSSIQNVTLGSTTSGASFIYTTDGTPPTYATGLSYSGPIAVSATTTIRAFATRLGNLDSGVTSATYNINLIAAAPSFGLPAGNYFTTQSITITSPTPGVSIRYTTDGTTPTAMVGTLYSGPVVVNSDVTLKAIAYAAGYADSTVSSAAYTITYPGGALSSPWAGQDVGSVGVAGSSGYASGVYTIAGAGILGGTSDSFRFIAQPLSGDGTIIARVVGEQGGSSATQIGVMIRETLTANSTMAFMARVSSSTQVNLYSRTSTGGSRGTATGSNIAAPAWLQVKRQGDTFTGYSSTDGLTWTPVGSVTIPMGTNTYVGLAVAGGSTSTLVNAAFDSVIATVGTPDFYLVPTPSSRTVSNVSNNSSYFSLRIQGFNNFTGTTSFTAAGLPSGVSASFGASPTGAGSTVVTLNTAAGTAAGTYPFTVTATNGAIVHSVNLSVTVSASAVALPQPWESQDFGTTGIGGTANVSGSLVTLHAGGVLGGASDSFRYAYFSLSGDSTVIAKLNSAVFANDNGRTGIMIRESLENNSAYSLTGEAGQFLGSPTTGYQYRSLSGGASTLTVGSTQAKPYWMKLSRSGTQLTGYWSPDGVNWIQTGTQTISMSPTVFVGVALGSGSTSSAGDATFDLFSAINAPDFYLSVKPASATFPNGTTNAYFTVVNNPLNGFAGSVTYSATGLPGGFTAGFGAGNSPTLTISSALPMTAGSYPFTVTGVSGALSHSAPATLVITSEGPVTLPSPWAMVQVGTPVPTTAGYANGTFTFSGTGTGSVPVTLSGSDSVQFVYKPLTGDGAIIAKIDLNQFGGDWGGLMIRETLDPRSPTAFVGESGSDISSGQAQFFSRGVFGSTPTNVQGSFVGSSFWAKLVRQGNVFTGYVSSDGLDWGTAVGSATVSMAPNVFIGLASWKTDPRDSSMSNVLLATAPDFYLKSTAGTVPQGGSPASFTVNASSLLGFTGTISLTAANLPSGAVATFTPNSLPGGSGSSALSITTTASMSGNYPFVITGTSGSLTRTLNATLTVKGFAVSIAPATRTIYRSDQVQYTVTVTGGGGFNAAVALSVTGLPSGMTSGWSATSVTPTAANPVVSSTLTLTSTSTQAASTTNFTVTGTSSPFPAQNTTGTVIVSTSPAYRLTVSPASQRLNASGSIAYPVSVTRFNGFTGAINLGTTGLTTVGATGTFSPTSIASGATSSTLTVATTRTTTLGTTNFTVDSMSSLPAQQTPATLIVDPPPTFFIELAPSSATVPAGTAATYKVNVVPLYGFTSAVTLTVSGLPTGASINPAILASGTGQVTLIVPTTGASGIYNFTITGTCTTGPCGASLVQQAAGRLEIGSQPDFGLSATAYQRSVRRGFSLQGFDIAITPFNGFSGTPTFSITGLPTGATASFSEPSQGNVRVSVTTSLTAPVGIYPVTVTGTSGSLSHSVQFTIFIDDTNFVVLQLPAKRLVVGDAGNSAAYPISLSTDNAFDTTQPLVFSASGPPSCAASSVALATVNVNAQGCTSAAAGSYPVVVTAQATRMPFVFTTTTSSGSLSLVDYQLTAAPTAITVNRGSSGTVAIGVTRVPATGFTENVNFTATVSPANARVTPTLNPTSGSSSTLTITVASNATRGTFTVTVSGVLAGGASPARTVPITLTIP